VSLTIPFFVPTPHRNGCPWHAIAEANQLAVSSFLEFEVPRSGWEGRGSPASSRLELRLSTPNRRETA
jgi:hypothetical protein